MSRNNPPKRDNYPSDAAYEYAVRQYQERYPTPETGALNWNQTKRWDGNKWNDVNIINRGQRAKLNGENVYADGRGNWRSLATLDVMGSRQSEGDIVGTYGDKPQSRNAFSDLRGSITPGSLQPAADNLGEGAAMDAAERYRAGKGYPAGIQRPGDYPVAPVIKDSGNGGNGGNGEGITRDNMKDATELDRMRTWMNAGKNNMEMAKRVKPGQAGYEEIQAVLAEKEGGPGADNILEKMYQSGRSAEDAAALLSDKEMSLEWNTDMPLTGRSVAAPLAVDGVPQTGTLMGGSITPGLFANTLGNQGYTEGDLKNSFTSIALPGTPDARAQMQLLPAEIQTPEGFSNVEIDSISGAGNNFATALDQSRALGFISGEDAQRITERFYRK